jgi:hypothetical protein
MLYQERFVFTEIAIREHLEQLAVRSSQYLDEVTTYEQKFCALTVVAGTLQ